MVKKKVILILGTGHCGSTLLELLLSSHQNAVGVGELKALAFYKAYFQRTKPVCDFHGFNDSLWSNELLNQLEPFMQDYSSMLNRFLTRFLPQISIHKNRRKVYSLLLAHSGKDYLIDNSKHWNWVKKSYFQLLNDSEAEPFIIMVSRLPHAIINAYARENPAEGFDFHLQKHFQRVNEMERFYDSIPKFKMKISYESLATDTASVLRSICDALGMTFDPSMLRYWEHEHHSLAGNPGTKSFIYKYHKIDPKLSNEKMTYYGNHPLGIHLDARWKKELKQEQIEQINSFFNYSSDL